MRVLLTNHSLASVGGTEKWTYTVAKELAQRGHQVTAYTFLTGTTSERMSGFCDVITEPEGEYDLILVNHNTCLGMVYPLEGYKIFTSHGPLHELERPAQGADAYVTVSRESQGVYARDGFITRVITNGIDLEEYYPQPTFSDRPVVLCMCKQGAASDMVEEACKKVDYDLMTLHYLDRPVWNVAQYMREADIIIGCGRTAYEGLACNKQVLVFDWRDKRAGPRSDGWLREDNIDHIRQYNCSCRAYGVSWGVEDLVKALQHYQPGSWGRAWAEQNADIRTKVAEYLKLYDENIFEGANQQPAAAADGAVAAVV